MNEALLKFMAEKLGKTVEQLQALSAEQLQGELAKLKFLTADEATQFSTATGRITELETQANAFTTVKQGLEKQVTDLTTAKTELEKPAEYGRAYETRLREEATVQYNKFSNGNPDATISAGIATQTVQQLEANIKMWGGKAFEAFGATCTKCGTGANIEMRSTTPEDEGGTPGGQNRFGRQVRTNSLAAAARQ